jgi:hypothetical protein
MKSMEFRIGRRAFLIMNTGNFSRRVPGMMSAVLQKKFSTVLPGTRLFFMDRPAANGVIVNGTGKRGSVPHSF